jgi:hypothetical protein
MNYNLKKGRHLNFNWIDKGSIYLNWDGVPVG